MSSPMPFPDGLVWVGTGRHEGRGTPPRTKETKPCWIRDGRPRALRARWGRGMGDREGRAGWATARVAGWATARVAGWATARVAGWATARVAGWATARVAGWATARVAPTRASSLSCSGCMGDPTAPGGRAVAQAGFPMASFGSVRVTRRAAGAGQTGSRFAKTATRPMMVVTGVSTQRSVHPSPRW